MDGPSSTVCFGSVGKTLPEVGSVDKLSTPGDCPSTPPCSSHPPACYMEEEKPIIPGVTVRAAPAEKLVQLAVESFSEDGVIKDHCEYPRVFFLMHKWFLSSNDLAEAFVDLYQSCDETIACTKPTCSHAACDTDCEIFRYKAKICHAVRYWIKNFPVHFDLDAKLREVVQNFRSVLKSEDSRQFEMVDLSKVPSYEWIRNMSVRNTSVRQHRKVSLVFNHLESDELAEQLTFLEYKAFRRITFSDFKHYAIHASLKENPKLERSIALFNGLSQWIQCMVLSKTTPQQRADVINKFVNVAKRLKTLQNFNTLMAVVGGLTHSSLARLAKTNGCLSSEKQKTLMEFTELLSSNNNFSNYRRALAQCTGFRIPILGVHLKDLISLHIALPDRVEGNLINFRKMAQLSIILEELTKLQHESVPVEANMDLINTIKLSLDLHYTEDEIYELSLAREPRSSLSSPSTPTKPVVFADWVAGVSPPDPETINKHVHNMVEAVFKNYDHDKDGFISHGEFDAIAGNFPFIDSFCVLDADEDGMISKMEMKTYFIRANCHALRSSFKHDFHETTYFKPTFCIHCTGLLWGLIKQGWKCKDCAINAHKHCKDLVVMECRGKMGSAGRRTDSMLNGSMSPNDLTLSTKRKMSQRQRLRRIDQSTQTNSRDFSHDAVSLASHSSGRSSGHFSSCSYNSVSTDSGIGPIPDVEYCEDPTQLHERLLRAEEAREKLMAENEKLRSKLDVATDNIFTLKSHIGLIRQHTINFILNQMDTLHLQRDTEV